MGFIKTLITKLVAKGVARSLGLVEGPPMENNKPWYKSTTVWSGITTVLFGLYDSIGTNLAPSFGWTLPQIPAWIFSILAALGIYGRVTADKKIG